MEELQRRMRALDLDLSDALEKFQRLSARMAKRTQRLEPAIAGEAVTPIDPISARILARRMAGKPPPRLEEDDGVLSRG